MWPLSIHFLLDPDLQRARTGRNVTPWLTARETGELQTGSMRPEEFGDGGATGVWLAISRISDAHAD